MGNKRVRKLIELKSAREIIYRYEEKMFNIASAEKGKTENKNIKKLNKKLK